MKTDLEGLRKLQALDRDTSNPTPATGPVGFAVCRSLTFHLGHLFIISMLTVGVLL